MVRKAVSLFLTLLVLVSVGMVLSSTASAKEPKGAAAVQAPNITLERVEIAHYWSPFFLDAKEKRGSVMDLAFVFNIENPNKSNIKLEDLKFTVNFEPGFDIITVTTNENFYIPGKTTNQLRVYATFDAFTTRLSLLVTGGNKLQELKISAEDQLKNWWDGIQDFKFKIKVTEGTATFYTGKETILSSFEAQFPQ